MNESRASIPSLSMREHRLSGSRSLGYKSWMVGSLIISFGFSLCIFFKIRPCDFCLFHLYSIRMKGIIFVEQETVICYYCCFLCQNYLLHYFGLRHPKKGGGAIKINFDLFIVNTSPC